MKLLGGNKSIAIAIGLIIIVFLVHRLIWHRPPVPVIQVKQVEVQGKVHGPGTVQAKVPVTVSAKITGILEKLYADDVRPSTIGDYEVAGQARSGIEFLGARRNATHGIDSPKIVRC